MSLTTTEAPEIGRWEPDAQDYFLLRELIYQARTDVLEDHPNTQYGRRYIADLLGRILDASDFRPRPIPMAVQP